MKYKICSIKGFEGLYHIYENGDVYSVRKKRLLVPKLSGRGPYSYYYVSLSGEGDYPVPYLRTSVHRLVAYHFIGKKQFYDPKYEVNHKDLDKLNNHFTNLEYVTHQENMLHAMQRKSWDHGRKPGFNHSLSTKQLMAEKKFKKVLLFNSKEEFILPSIEETISFLKTYRKKFNRYVGTNKELEGYRLKIVS